MRATRETGQWACVQGSGRTPMIGCLVQLELAVKLSVAGEKLQIPAREKLVVCLAKAA